MKRLVLVMLCLFAPMVNAGVMCDTRYQGNTVVSTDCELGTTNNDSEAQVNLDLMFGYDDWSYAWKDDSTDALPAWLTSFNMDVDLLGGDFSLLWGANSTADVMFVLKDGNDDPDTYVSWLLDPGDFGVEGYDFTTPFLNLISGDLKQISHGTFYVRNGDPGTRCVDCTNTNEVPEPAPLALIGAGLLVLRTQIKRKQNG